MAYKTPAHVRAGSHRAMAIKAILDGVAAEKSYEEICNDIHDAVTANGGSINHNTKYGWYRDLHQMIKNADGSDICPPPAERVKAPKAKVVSEAKAETPKAPEEVLASIADQIKEAAEEATEDAVDELRSAAEEALEEQQQAGA